MTHQPSDALRRLDRLAGTWTVSGGTEGTVTSEWMEGGFFLLQHVDMTHDGAWVYPGGGGFDSTMVRAR